MAFSINTNVASLQAENYLTQTSNFQNQTINEVTSGLRIGSPALTTRGLGREDFVEIGEIIGVALGPEFEARRGELLERVGAIVERYPLYESLPA